MKEVLTELLKLVNLQMAFLTQMAADVAALKKVVADSSPETEEALKQQITSERKGIEQHMDALKVLQAMLEDKISKLPN